MGMKRILITALMLLISGCALTPGEPALEFSSIDLGQDPAAVAPVAPAPTEPEGSDEADESGEPEYALDRNAEIDIEDQSGDGNSVMIDEIQISGGNSFLVIYDSTGLVRSSTLVTVQSQPVVVRFEVPIEKSQELEAVLYLDNGDGQFSLAEDSPLLDYERELVHEDFYYTVVSGG